MEYNVFRDYCKAENSEDEEINHDLQSRLYAEIYYASNDTKNVDTKTNIKLETTGIDDENLHQSASTSKIYGFNDTSKKNDANKNYGKLSSINDSIDNSALIEKDNKPDIKSICITNETGSLSKEINTKSNSNESCIKTLRESEENIEFSKNNKQLTTRQNVEYTKSSSNYNTIHNIETDVHVKPKIKGESKEQLKSVHCINNETTINQFTHLNSAEKNIDNNNGKCQEIAPSKTNTDNIFKKYEFSKTFINKLYLEKYENIQKKLKKIGKQERSLKEEEQEKINVKQNKENYQQQELEKYKKSLKELEMSTKYAVLSKTDKMQKGDNYSEEITVLLSETESESEDSILEVPIPPKPQPPVINLQDSDESSEASSSDSDTDQESSFIIEKAENTKSNSFIINQDSDNSTSSINCINDTSAAEDIILNCTEVQKGASSIKEIMEMKKNIQSDQYPDEDNSFFENYNYTAENPTYYNDFDESDKFLFTSDEDDTSEFQLPSKIVNDSNAIYERDKNESINFAEDVMVSNFLNPKELTPNRKRHHENDSEPSTSAEQGRDTASESKRSKTTLEQHNNKDKTNEESWEEYFFRPMSENLKAFYNESRGQESFDIQEVQSKMSKDPRLWAILDEDLMPDLLRRHRYWNMKCANCHQQGHQKHNCPDSYKPLRCHMCGTQGHTEMRCPQKMCLTCGKKQGTFRKTCESCRTLYCNMCNAIGHKSTECPDLWRRFHQTTRTSDISIPENLSEVMKPADLLYCCNCTKRGHDSSTCNEYRWSQHFPTPAFVSNYTGGPEYEVPIHENTNEDIIPLTKLKKHKSMIFLPGKDDLDSSYVVYAYGLFYTNKPNGQEIKRKLMGEQVTFSHIVKFLKCRVSPTFLDQLAKIVSFEIKIYYNTTKELMIRVRSIADTCRQIFEIFIYWLKLDDRDKHLDMSITLPRNTKKMLKLLTTKMEEIDKNLQDPELLCTKIEEVKESMIDIKDGVTLNSAARKLTDLQGSLMKVFHTRPKCSMLLNKFKKVIKYLKSSPFTEVVISQYLNIITIYNKIFLPRKLSSTELQRLFRQYYKAKDKIKERENKTKKQKKKKLNPYKTFLEELQKYNSSTSTKKTCNKTDSNDVCSSKNIEKTQFDQIPTTVSTVVENAGNSGNSIQSNVLAPISNTQYVFTDTYNIENNVTESIQSTEVYPIERVQLPYDPKTSQNNEVTIPTQNSNLITISPNLIPISLQKSTHTNISSRTSKNVPCAKVKPSENNTEKHSKVVNSNSEVAKTSNLQQDNIINSEISVTKKKKSKKSKKAKVNLENNSEVTENQGTSIDTSLEDRANQIINEALEFNLPYMDKAVEEIRKRIHDKSLKQEHIDTLLRLITLENDHRKYVSSFCNYLQ